ncbi:MAG: chloride channel protein [Desulfobulbus sp.]
MANTSQTATEHISRPLPRISLLLLAVLTGFIAGFGALIFRGLIALVHNGLFLGTFSLSYDANQHTPASPWGAAVVFVPVLGALIVTFLVTRFAPEAKGHGVPEVMDAVYYGKGIIRPVVALFKALASAFCIGTGGSVGREGPIAQIGSAFGSTMSQVFPMTAKQRITLIAAGAGGGIAATFNTPIGGLLFAIELLMHEVSVSTLVPVALATVTATYIGQLFFGVHPAFVIPALEQPYFSALSPWVLLYYAILGLGMGALAALYIRSLYAFEDLFGDVSRRHPYLCHAGGMFAVGVLMYGIMLVTGHYYIDGVGYSAIEDALSGQLLAMGLMAALFGAKLLATCLTLGSGGSGGIFSPALFLGATGGGAFGVLCHQLFPGMAISPAAFAVAGMAGMVGGATGAPMTAIVMIFEMTLDYSVILPITITVALSFGLRTLLVKESIYTLKLVRRGHYMPAALQVNLLQIRSSRDVMQIGVARIDGNASLDQLRQLALASPAQRWFLVVEREKVVGIIARDGAWANRENGGQDDQLVADYMRHDFIFAAENEKLTDLVERMHHPHASVAVVLGRGGHAASEGAVVGLITWEDIAEVLEESADLFSEYREGGRK